MTHELFTWLLGGGSLLAYLLCLVAAGTPDREGR